MSEIIEEYAEHLKAQGFCLKDVGQRDAVVSDLDPRAESPLTYRTISNHFTGWCEGEHRWKVEYWDYIRDHLTLVVGTLFEPKGREFISHKAGIFFKNTWREFVPSHAELPGENFLHGEAMERLFPAPQDLEMVTKWIAHLFQKPEERPSFHLMLRSDHGTGKGFLFNNVLLPLLSYQAQSFKSFSAVTEKHATFLEDSLLAFLDDVTTSTENQQHQLKSMLTEEYQTVRPLNQKEKLVRTYTRFILTSNEDEPLKLEEQDRRWYVVEKITHPVSEEETKAFYKRYGEWAANPDNLSTVYNYYMSIDLSDFEPKQHVRTEAFWEMLQQGQSLHDHVAQDWMTDHPVFTYKELTQHFDAREAGIVFKKLKDAGYVSKQPYQNVIDPRTGTTNKDKYWAHKSMTTAEIREYLSPSREQKPLLHAAF